MRGRVSWAHAAALAGAWVLAGCSGHGLVGTGTAMSALLVQTSGGSAAPSSTFECITNQLTAVAVFTGDGSSVFNDFTNRVKWSSSDPGTLYVGDGKTPGPEGVILAPGVFIGLRPGTATVTAKYLEDFTTNITVNVLPVDSLRITPALTDVGANTAQTFSVEARFQTGTPWVDITPNASWTLPVDQGEATVSANGVLAAVNSNSSAPLTLRATLAGCERTVDSSFRVSPVQSLGMAYEAGASTVMPLAYSDIAHVYANFAAPGSTQQEVSDQVILSGVNDNVLGLIQTAAGISVDAAGVEGSSGFNAALPAPSSLSVASKTWQTRTADLQSILLTPPSQTVTYPDTGLLAALGTFTFANGDPAITWPVTREITWTSDNAAVSLVAGGTSGTGTNTDGGTVVVSDVTDAANITATLANLEAVAITAQATVQVHAFSN